MKEFVETLIGRLEECKKIEKCNLYSGIEEGFGYGHCSDAFEDGQTLGAFNAYSSMLDFIKELAEEYNNGLISCNQRLPNCEKEFLVTLRDGEVAVARYEKEENIWVDIIEGYFEYPVVAWCELPEPYKKGSETDE
jgi:hypothetical protein